MAFSRVMVVGVDDPFPPAQIYRCWWMLDVERFRFPVEIGGGREL